MNISYRNIILGGLAIGSLITLASCETTRMINTRTTQFPSTSISYNGELHATTTPIELQIKPTPTALVPSTASVHESLVLYSNEEMGITFYHPSYADVQFLYYPEDDYRLVEISYGSEGALIDIDYELNPGNLSPRQWFEENINNYNEYINEIAELSVDGHPAFILGVPDTCATTPLILIIINVDTKIFKFHYFDLPRKSIATELSQLLETLTIDNKKLTKEAIEDELVRIPEAPKNVTCP